MWAKNKHSGFTIVELLIVIVVIGILASVTIVAYNGVQERARVSRAVSELSTIKKAILSARINQDKTLLQITGQGCTCGNAARMATSLDALSAASGANLASLKAGDPWGNQYYMDENEGEAGPTDCRIDTLFVNPGHSGVPSEYIPRHICPN